MERKLAAILHADVQGYSRLIGEDEVATLRTLTPYLDMMSARVRNHGGRVAGSAGDSLLAEFPSVVEAVHCAVEMQQELKARNAQLPVARRVVFRMGINLGEIVVDGEQIHGDGINIAVRLEGLAPAGGICLSEVVYKQLKNKLALAYEDMGEHALKNIAEPVRVYRVVEPGAPPPLVSPTHRGRFPHKSRVALLGGGILLLLGIIVIVQHLDFRLPTSSVTIPPGQALPLPDKPSLAVLPFVNMSDDPQQEYFSDGMTEDLITDLSRLSGLFVIARTSTFTYKGKAVKVEDVGRELGVQYVLEGSVRKADNRVLITAQLVEARTGHHVWAERYDRPLQDLFALQEEVRRKIMAHLALKLTDEEEAQWERAYTRNLEAYDYLLRGLEYQWHFTKEAFVQGRQMYQKAIELDPTYAVAYAWLGWTYFMEWAYQLSDDPQALEQAFAMEQQAIALDDSSPLAHDILGAVYLWRNKQPEQSIAEARRAIALSPNFYSPYSVLGISLIFAGRPAEAVDAMEKAIRLNPRNPLYLETYLTVLGSAYSSTGRVEEAITTLKRAVSLIPNDPAPHQILASIYSALGREEEARAEAVEVLRLNPSFSLEGLRQRLPFKDPAQTERVLADLRKAGLK